MGAATFIGSFSYSDLGRLYCGFACPISSTIDLIGYFKPWRPTSKKHKEIFFDNKVRLITLLASLALLITFIKTKFPVPFFVALIPIGLVFTYLFGEAAWHRNCFIGTIYSLLGGISRKGYYIQNDLCLSCGKCEKICPSGCLEIKPTGVNNIDNKHCLICGKCQNVCPDENIVYGSLKNTKTKAVQKAFFD